MDVMAEKFQKAKESGQEMDESLMSFTSANTIDAYNKRMGDVLQDMYDLKYI